MDKVIIDGVDVSECEYFTSDYQRANNIEGRYEHCKNVCELNGDNYFYCKLNKDCYYKQLQRTRAEIEELKAGNKKMYQSMHKEICEIDEELELEKASHKDDLKTLKQYGKCLKEIKEIVDKNISFMDTASTTKAMIRIQDKISECIGVE